MATRLEEIQSRRIFGIISHPDAGKTTLTEKLLLHGGAIREAGTVKARRNSKYNSLDTLFLLQSSRNTIPSKNKIPIR